MDTRAIDHRNNHLVKHDRGAWPGDRRFGAICSRSSNSSTISSLLTLWDIISAATTLFTDNFFYNKPHSSSFMTTLIILSTFTALLCVSIGHVSTRAVVPRDVINPPITYPTAGTQWNVGERHNVTWCVLPP